MVKILTYGTATHGGCNVAKHVSSKTMTSGKVTVLNKSLTKYTQNTIASVDTLIKEIEQVRIRKVTIDDEEP